MIKFITPPFFALLAIIMSALIFWRDFFASERVYIAFIFFTLAVHILAIITRKTRRTLFGIFDAEWLGTVPNLSIFVLVLNYTLGFVLLDVFELRLQVAYFATAAAVLAVVMSSHLMADMLSKPIRFEKYALPVEAPRAIKLTSTGRDLVYGVRITGVLSSLGMFAYIGVWGYTIEIACFALFLQLAYLIVLFRFVQLIGKERKHRQDILRRTSEAYFRVFQPAYMLYYSKPASKDSILLQNWIQSLSSLSIPFITLVREKAHFTRLVKAGVTNVVFADTMDLIERFVSKKLKAVITLNNSAKNAQVVRFDHIHQVNILPANILATDPFPNSFDMYSDLFCLDRMTAHKARDAGISATITILESDMAIQSRSALARRNSKNAGPVTTIGCLLSAPNGDWSLAARTFKAIISIVQGRDKPTTLIVRADQVRTGEKNAESTFSEIIAAISQFPSAAGNRTTFLKASQISLDATLNQSDILLCDLTRVNDDLLALGKPIILTDIIGWSGIPFATPAALDACYRMNADLSNLDIILKDIEEIDSMKASRHAIIKALDNGIETLTFEQALIRLSK
jgi:hypothetical protein